MKFVKTQLKIRKSVIQYTCNVENGKRCVQYSDAKL